MILGAMSNTMSEVVTGFKYLGSIVDDKLCLESNTGLLCKKGQRRLYCLRKLVKCNVDKTLLTLSLGPVLSRLLSSP